jgi:RNA polymerase sigma-70 factor, ECF subfamily
MEKTPETSDDTLMSQIQAGDKAAFDLLYERYQPEVRSYLLRILQREAAADDVAQDVFLRVWTHACQWRAIGPLRAWLYRIATYQAFNYLRAGQRHPEQPLEDPDTLEPEEGQGRTVQSWLVDTATLGPDAAFEAAERLRLLDRLIGRLPEEKRAVFNLVAEMELSIQHTAERLGIPAGTVKSRLHYARNWLSQNWPDPDHW